MKNPFNDFKIRLAEMQMRFAYHGEKRDSGKWKITHLEAVANQMKTTKLKICGFLHDAVEDGKMTLTQIRHFYGEPVARIVDIVSWREGEVRPEYIARVLSDPEAIILKLADNKANAGKFCRNPSQNRTEKKLLEAALRLWEEDFSVR